MTTTTKIGYIIGIPSGTVFVKKVFAKQVLSGGLPAQISVDITGDPKDAQPLDSHADAEAIIDTIKAEFPMSNLNTVFLREITIGITSLERAKA